jgi:chorismate synthase
VVIVDGCPPGIELSPDDFVYDLGRRRPGQSHVVTQRQESDRPQILSGVFDGLSTGTPIAIVVPSEDARSRDYSDIKDKYRPGHADYTYEAKFGRRDYRGGGRASARETVSRVAAGVIAKKLLHKACGADVVAYVTRVGDVIAEPQTNVERRRVDTFADGSPNLLRCPDHDAARRMIELVERMKSEGDSVGGIAEIVATGIPAGLGEPVFDKLKADLGRALLSLPAVLGVEYGSGFAAAGMRGSENNDVFIPGTEGGQGVPAVVTRSNRHGGILGGISSGMPIVLRAVVKPTSSLPQAQETVTTEGERTSIQTKGRHDPCLLPRFIPMAEAMVAITLADHWLRQRASKPL